MRWLWRGSLPRQIRRMPLLRTDPYLIVCCLDGSGTCIDRPAIDCRIRSLPRASSHTNNQVRSVLIERQPISPPIQERFLYFFLGLTATYIYHAIPKEHRWNLGRVGPEVGRVAIRVDDRQQANALAVECQHQSERSVLVAQEALILRQMLGLTGKISSSCLNSRAILGLWNRFFMASPIVDS